MVEAQARAGYRGLPPTPSGYRAVAVAGGTTGATIASIRCGPGQAYAWRSALSSSAAAGAGPGVLVTIEP